MSSDATQLLFEYALMLGRALAQPWQISGGLASIEVQDADSKRFAGLVHPPMRATPQPGPAASRRRRGR